ncbi:MAG: phosphopantetheine-binding protein [Solirubrobacterales bacterium]
MNDHAAAIEQFIVTNITGDGESLSRDQDLLAAELIDSLGITELVGFIEAELGVEVDDEDLTPENFRTVNGIAAFVSRKGG